VPFAAAFLQQAQQLDLTVVLATSSNPDEVDANLAVIGCRRQDFMVVDKDDARTSKPAPDVFAVALQRVSAKPGDAIALGDTRWDGEAAGRTGVPFWGVLTGAGTRAELEAGGASHIFPDLVALGEGLRRALSPAG
jgi:phosphoglycolate phosphatase-like HAD superfamily hydrolase